jgi:hypothetical protein
MTFAEFIGLAQLRLGALGRVAPLDELRAVQDQLRTDGQLLVTEQALMLISHLYVNLFLKREIHATDPEQSLRNLRNELLDITRSGLEDMSDERFHARMEAIFTALRDRHTVYELPDPYRRTIAFLPFVVEYSDEPPGYFVTKVLGDHGQGFKTPTSVTDAPRVTHWNGVAIERAVALNGDRNAGANHAARMARGLDRLTFRWLGTTIGPDEAWVDVTYEILGTAHTKRFRWGGLQVTDQLLAEISVQGTAVGRDGEGEWIRRVRTQMHARRQMTAIGRDRLDYRERTINGEEYGYLRLYTFDITPEEEDDFIAEVGRILAEAPAGGLIIDVRGNPGGQITTAERMVALFSPKPVQCQQLHFRNTAEATTLAERLYKSTNAFNDNVLEARATAAPFIASPPLAGDAVDERQVYQGPVTVLFDALTYSAAEVFTAGMIDQRLAVACGTTPQTGGGGANVWTYDLIASTLNDAEPAPAAFPPLPYGTSFNVAVRRITRVGARSGVALEDLGVLVDEMDCLPVTLADLLDNNEELIATAAGVLKDEAHRSLSATDGGNGSWTISAGEVDRAVLLLDGVIVLGVSDPDGQTVQLPDSYVDANTLKLQGFAGSTMVLSIDYALSG